jgi:hypothetical protein
MEDKCWVCMGPICRKCWEEEGDCGHTQEIIDARRVVLETNPFQGGFPKATA